MDILGAAHRLGGGGQKGAKRGAFLPPAVPKICHTYPAIMYILLKEDTKNIWITCHTPWVLLTAAFFHWKSANFGISRNADIDCILVHNFYSF